MDNFVIVIFLITILIVLSAFTDKIKLPHPILLVFAGLIIGFVPFLPNLKLDPDIVFLIFLPRFCTMPHSELPGLTLKKRSGPFQRLPFRWYFLLQLVLLLQPITSYPGLAGLLPLY
jgi:CPA1 family monovalent cation:H+ antiporter